MTPRAHPFPAGLFLDRWEPRLAAARRLRAAEPDRHYRPGRRGFVSDRLPTRCPDLVAASNVHGLKSPLTFLGKFLP